MSITRKQTTDVYLNDILAFINGEKDWKQVTERSFTTSWKGGEEARAEYERLRIAQATMLQHAPKEASKGEHAHFTYLIDSRGNVEFQTPPSMPKWKANIIKGQEDQFKRKAKEMRRIEKKLAARGIQTQGIAMPHK